MPNSRPIESDLGAAIAAAIPQLDQLREAAGGVPLYLVGGAVRDLLLKRRPAQLDVAVEGDAAAVARNLGGEVLEHAPFLTAVTRLGDWELDLTSTRTETYPAPGALPEVEPATLAEDLPRRDFSINAIAWPLQGDEELIDPLSGLADLRSGLLRVLHDGSFIDDPTRALRAARYAGRLDFELEAKTAALIDDADLDDGLRGPSCHRAIAAGTASPVPPKGCCWPPGGAWSAPARAPRTCCPWPRSCSPKPLWSEAPRPRTMLRAALGPEGRESALAAARPAKPSEAVDLARDCRPEELVLGRAMGAEWLDDYMGRWRGVALEIDGAALIDAGVPEGPAVGRGLAEALRRKLDGEIGGREEELRVALEAAGQGRDTMGEQPDNGGDAVA